MRVLLLNEINKYDSIGIELLAAVLKEQGHWARVCIVPDLIVNTTISLKFLNVLNPLFQVEDEKYVDYLLLYKPDVVCFSAVTSYISRCQRLAGIIRAKAPRVHLVVGGPHPTVATDYVVRMNAFDYVCKGEGEVMLPALVKALERGETAPDVPGVYTLQAGACRGDGIGEIVEDLDSLPMPDKEDVIRDYPFFEGVYMYNSMRSCAYDCTYCGSPHMRREYDRQGLKVYRRKSVERVMQELVEAKKRYPGLHTIGFVDDTLTMGKKWIHAFAEEYEKRVHVPFFGCTNPVLLQDEELIRKLKRAGLVYIEIGVQALDERLRIKEIRRPDTDEHILACARLLRKHGIYIQVNHIFGLDRRDFHDTRFLQETVEFYLRLKPNRTHCFELEYLPNTEISLRHLESGELARDDYEAMMRGEKSVSYNFGGSIGRHKEFMPYIVLLEMRPFLPESVIRFLMYNRHVFRVVRKIPLGYLVFARLLNTILHPGDVEGRPHYGKYWSGMKHVLKIKGALRQRHWKELAERMCRRDVRSARRQGRATRKDTGPGQRDPSSETRVGWRIEARDD